MSRESKSQESPIGSDFYASHLDFMKSLMDINSSISHLSEEYAHSVAQTLEKNMTNLMNRKQSYDKSNFLDPLVESSMRYSSNMSELGFQYHNFFISSAQEYAQKMNHQMKNSMHQVQPFLAQTQRYWDTASQAFRGSRNGFSEAQNDNTNRHYTHSSEKE